MILPVLRKNGSRAELAPRKLNADLLGLSQGVFGGEQLNTAERAQERRVVVRRNSQQKAS